MLKHLALEDGAFDMRMNVRQLAPDCIIDVDPASYAAELALKDDILASDAHYYYQTLPGTEAMQWETVEILLPNMARHYPAHFTLTTDGDHWRWTNRLLGTETAFTLGDPATLPLPPLDWVGRQVQEDLCVMDGNDATSPLVAGHLCFASGWCLDDKMGRSFLAIHGPVPLFAEKIGRPADLMMQRVKVSRPTARVNWTIHPSDRLNCALVVKRRYAFEHEGINPENAGTRYYLRSEWQTFIRYPRTNAVLFTIRTRVQPLADALVGPDDARRLATLLRTMPPAMRDYKSLTRHVDTLLAYLEVESAHHPDSSRSCPLGRRGWGGLFFGLPAAGEAFDARVLLAERCDLEAAGAVERDGVLIGLRVEGVQPLLLDDALNHPRADPVAAHRRIHRDVQQQRGVPPDPLDAEDADGPLVLRPDVELPLGVGVDGREQVIQPPAARVEDARGDQFLQPLSVLNVGHFGEHSAIPSCARIASPFSHAW